MTVLTPRCQIPGCNRRKETITEASGGVCLSVSNQSTDSGSMKMYPLHSQVRYFKLPEDFLGLGSWCLHCSN